MAEHSRHACAVASNCHTGRTYPSPIRVVDDTRDAAADDDVTPMPGALVAADAEAGDAEGEARPCDDGDEGEAKACDGDAVLAGCVVKKADMLAGGRGLGLGKVQESWAAWNGRHEQEKWREEKKKTTTTTTTSAVERQVLMAMRMAK